METNNLKLNKAICILYVVVGSFLMLDAIINCALTFTVYIYHAFFMYNIILMSLCEIAVFVCSLVFAIGALKKVNSGTDEEALKAASDLNLLMKFVYSIAFTINLLAWTWFFALIGGFIYVLVFMLVIALFIGLLIISIIGKSIQNKGTKATFTTTCSILNFIITFILLIITGIIALASGIVAGYVFALMVFVAIDIIAIVLSMRQHASSNNQNLTIEDRTTTQN